MGAIWNGTKKVGRFMFYPAVRVAQDIDQSQQRIRQDLDRLRAKRELDRAGAAEAARIAGQGGPADRFQALVDAGNWTQQELQGQWIAVRRTKWVALMASIFAFVLACSMLFWVPVWALLILAPAALGMAALGIARVVQFGLYQAQLEERALISFKDYMSRSDFFSHLVS
jgi:hypothetical protein